MNYINYFQKGGSVQPSPQEVIGGALEILGIDQKTAVSKLEQIAQSGDEETLQSIYNASAIILQTAQNPTQESQQAAQYLTEIFSSKMFKCGGKLQQLTDKFAKGGKSKCGCGKKIRKGATGTDTNDIKTEKRDDIELQIDRRDSTFTFPDKNGKYMRLFRTWKNGVPETMFLEDPKGSFYEGVSPEHAFDFIKNLWNHLPKNSTQKVESNKCGGITKGQNGFELSQNRVLNKPQSAPDSTALKLRRDAMQPIVIEEPEENVTLDLNNFNFKDAFKIARRSGLNTFEWRGKLFNTEFKPKAKPKAKPKTLIGISEIKPVESNWVAVYPTIQTSNTLQKAKPKSLLENIKYDLGARKRLYWK